MIKDKALNVLYARMLDLIEDASALAPPSQTAPMLAAVVATYLNAVKQKYVITERELKTAWNKTLKEMQVAIRDHKRSLQS